MPVNLYRYAELLGLSIALEVSAYPKIGNVHRYRWFFDTLYEDFLIASSISIHHLYIGVVRGYRDRLGEMKKVFGDIVFNIVRDSIDISGGGNTCLGSSLLLSPIAIAIGSIVRKGSIDVDIIGYRARDIVKNFGKPLDTIYIYRAIRVARPSYIRAEDDTRELPNVWDNRYREKIVKQNIAPWTVLEYSSRNDIVAREVVEGFPRSLELSKHIDKRLEIHNDWNRAVVETYLYQLSRELDTLIIRKKGIEIAEKVMNIANEMYNICIDRWSQCLEKLYRIDEEFHRDGVNPGSTADIIVSSIAFYILRKMRKILRRNI